MKKREITLICRYAGEELSIAQVIRDSFEIFLKKELQHVEKHLRATVSQTR